MSHFQFRPGIENRTNILTILSIHKFVLICVYSRFNLFLCVLCASNEQSKWVVKIKLKAISFLVIVAMTLLSCSGKTSAEHILFDFESDVDLDRLKWKCHTLFSLSSEHVTHGTHSLKMELFPSDYPGFSPKLSEKDWSRHQTLSFDIFNVQDTNVTVIVRIDDQQENTEYADRYNQQFRLNSGANTVSILLDRLVTSGSHRRLDLKSIHKLIIFLSHPKQKHVFYLDHIRIH
jgi:hypothetical protein